MIKTMSFAVIGFSPERLRSGEGGGGPWDNVVCQWVSNAYMYIWLVILLGPFNKFVWIFQLPIHPPPLDPRIVVNQYYTSQKI